jgi:hypothetical protein
VNHLRADFKRHAIGALDSLRFVLVNDRRLHPQSPQRMTSLCLIAAAFNRSRPVPDKDAQAPSRERSLRLQLAPQDAKRVIPEVATKAT